MSQYKYSIDEFAQFIRDDFDDYDLSGYDNLQLVQDYFSTRPNDPNLQYIDAPEDMLFPTAVEEEIEQKEQEEIAQPQDEGIYKKADTTFASMNYQRAKQAYEMQGSDAAAGFWKQLGFNIQTSMRSVPGAFFGMIGWGANELGLDDDGNILEYAEDLRKWGHDWTQETIENDLELQALQLWNEDEPVKFFGEDKNFYELDVFTRGMASALPSMIEMAGMSLLGGGVAGLGYAYKGVRAGTGAMKAFNNARRFGKLQIGQTIGGVSTGVALEGSETWNTAMEYGKEQGMSNEEAARTAGVATMIAAPIKGSLEYFGFSRMAGAMGLNKVGARELDRIISGKAVQNALAKGGMKGLENSVAEGMTEWGQYMTDAMVQQGYKEGFGNNMEEFFTNAKKVVAEEGWSAGARESIYGGFLLGGSTGVGAGVRQGFGRYTPEKFANDLRELDEAADAKIAEDPKKLAYYENLREGGYYKYLNKAIEGLDEEQRKLFFAKAEEIYEPRGFDQTDNEGTISKVPTQKFVEDVDSENENLKTYVKGLIRTEERSPLGDTSKLPKEQKDLFDALKKIDDAPIEEKALEFVDKGKDKALKAVASLEKKEQDRFNLAVLKGIKKKGGLSAGYDAVKATPLQRQLTVNKFAEKGKVTEGVKTDVGGRESEVEFNLNTKELEAIYSGQDVSDAEIMKTLEEVNVPPENVEAGFTDDEIEQALAEAGERQVQAQKAQKEETKAVDEVDLSTLPTNIGGLTEEQQKEAAALFEKQTKGKEARQEKLAEIEKELNEDFDVDEQVEKDFFEKELDRRVEEEFKGAMGTTPREVIEAEVRTQMEAEQKARKKILDDQKDEKEIPIVNDENIEKPPSVEVSKLGVKKIKGTPKEGVDKLKQDVQKVIDDTEGVTLRNGHKSVWFGDVDYSYTGAKHKAKKMPELMKKLQARVEKSLGLEEGYYNSVLMNTLPKGEGINPHSDAEGIFLDKNKEIGSVGVLSFGGTTIIDIIDKKTNKIVEQIEVGEGDIYEMPAGKFQNAYLHGVGASDQDRISLTFRKTTAKPQPQAPKKEVVKEKEDTIGAGISQALFGATTGTPKKIDKKKTEEVNKKEVTSKKKIEIVEEKPSSLSASTPPSTNQDQSANLQASKSGAVPVVRDETNRKVVLDNGVEIQYNNDQQKGYDKLLDWALKKDGHFALQGYAGTGKSTLLNDVIEEVKARTNKPVMMLTPTHKAKTVLIRMGNPNVDTIASAFGLRPRGYKGEYVPSKDPISGKIIVPEKTADIKGGYMIIDESSMINDNLLAQALEVLEELNINAIFVGDGKQLAPVKQNHSSAFKTNFFTSRNISYDSHELTMVERQATDNPLFEIYTELRNKIGSLQWEGNVAFGFGGIGNNLTQVIDKKGNPTAWFANRNERKEGYAVTQRQESFINEAFKYFRLDDYKKDPNNTIITTGTHKRVAFFNNEIRKKLYKDRHDEQIVVGEFLMPSDTRGNQKYADNNSITSGTPMEVLGIEEKTKSVNGVEIAIYETTVRNGVDENGEDIARRTINIVKNTKPREFKSKYSNSEGDLNDTNKYYLNANEDYVQVRKDLELKYYKAQGKNEKRLAKIALDEFNNNFIYQGVYFYVAPKGYTVFQDDDVTIDYAYAVNIHKIQGSTYENVFYDEVGTHKHLQAGLNKKNLRKFVENNYQREPTDFDRAVVFNNRDRMAYTAVTRPTKNLFIFRPNNIGSLTALPTQKKIDMADMPDKFEYQENMSKDVPLVSERPVEFSQITDKLQKDFPEISLQGLEKVLATDGREVVGKAMGMLAQWSKSKATLDTVPHEYAHIYLNMYRNTAIVKQGIRKFGNENLADYMGLYYQDRMTGSLAKRFGMWAKQFWLKIKKLLGVKMSDQDVKDYLAGAFFSGKKLGTASAYKNNKWEWMNDEAPNEPEYQDLQEEDIGFNPADRATLSFFQREMKVRITKDDYGVIQELARKNDSYDSFYEQFKALIQAKYDTKAFEFTGRQKRNFEKWLKQTWHKSASKVPNWNGQRGLINLEAVRTKDGKHISFQGDRYAEIAGDGERRTLVGQKSIPDYKMSSYTDRDGVVTIRLRMGDMVQEIDRTDIQPDQKIWWKPDDFARFTADINDKNSWSIKDFSEMGLVFVASKGGDHSALLFTAVKPEYANMSKDDFIKYMDGEIANGNMTTEMANDFYKTNSTEQIPYGQIVARHEWWKSVKYPQYLMGTHIGSPAEKGMGVQDHYDRLKIDMNDGYQVRGLGESSIMTVVAGSTNPDGTITGTYFETEDGTQIPSGEFDGAMWSSGKWFKKLSQSLGEDNLTVIKGMVRNRIDNGADVDYIGVKSIQLRPYNGMKLYENGELLATYEGRNTNGSWVDAKTGEKFDHLSTTDTSKMTNGRFAKFNQVVPLSEGYQNVILNPSEEKNGAFPVTHGELAMMRSLLSTPVGKKFYNAIQKHYKEIGDSYTDDLFDFIKNPRKLSKELFRHIEENDIMPELQKFVEIVGEEGIGLIHPSIFKLWKDSITNKYIKDGLFKLRSRDKNKGSNLFYKPFYAPAMGKDFGELRQGDFVVSAESKSAVQLVQEKYQEATGEILTPPKNIFEGHATYWKKLNDWLLETDESGNYINNVPVLLSRQPVAKITGVVMRNIRGLAMGGHGKTMMLSKDDVLKVFDGDWDGDKGIVQIINNQEVVDAYMNFQQSPQFEKLDRVVNLDYFGKRLRGTSLSKGEDITKTINNINAGMRQIGMMTNGRNAMFSMHMKNLSVKLGRFNHTIIDPSESVVMDYINMNITEENREEIFEEIYNRSNDSIVYTTKSKETPIEIKDFEDLRSAMLNDSAVFHLKTTKSNELAVVLQMAVDDSKYGLLGSFKKDYHVQDVESESNSRKFDNSFITGLMFTDYNKTGILEQTYLNDIKSQFNFSRYRQGYDDNQNQMKLEGLMDISNNLNAYMDDKYHNEIERKAMIKVYQRAKIPVDKNGKIVIKPSDTKMRAKVKKILEQLGVNSQEYGVDYDFTQTTPQEDLMMSLGQKYDKMLSGKDGLLKLKLAPIQHLNPFQYNKNDMRLAAEVTKFNINKNVKAKLESKFEGQETLLDRQKGVKFAEDFSADFYGLFQDREDINVDFNEEVEELKDKWVPVWESLTPRQQTMSTIKMLQGTNDTFKGKANNKQAFRMTFFPLDVVHGETLKLYLRDWTNILTSPALKDLKPKDFRTMRTLQDEGGYNLNIDTSKLSKDLLEKKCG